MTPPCTWVAFLTFQICRKDAQSSASNSPRIHAVFDNLWTRPLFLGSGNIVSYLQIPHLKYRTDKLYFMLGLQSQLHILLLPPTLPISTLSTLGTHDAKYLFKRAMSIINKTCER